jgi:putative hemolysin
MPPFPWLDVAVIIALVLLNGFFALSELAIVSARKPRLRPLAETGNPGAASALALAESPGRFLSAVQIGITLVGIFNGAYSGRTLAEPIGLRIAALTGLPADRAIELGLSLVIILVTYASLIIGELVPKQLALRAPERLAVTVAPLMLLLARAATPAVWLLEQSTALVLRLFGPASSADAQVTEAELRSVMAEAETAGIIEADERAMISGVMRLADRRVRGVMTPRGEVAWLDADAPEAETRARLAALPHTRLPVARGTVDDIIGVIQSRDLVQALVEGTPLDLAALARPAPVIPDVIDAVEALAALRSASIPMALVHDEYGHFEGIVTPADLLAAIAGALDTEPDDEPALVERADGSLLLSGAMPADEMAERLGLTLEDSRDYETLAGFVLARLEHLPETGESFDEAGWRFEIVDMDGRKVDRILASRLAL